MQKLQHLADLVDLLVAFLTGLAPGAFGATVSLLYEKGLTWTDRFVQFAVGTIVSSFASRAVGGLWALDPFVLQGIGFTVGMIAFRATPRFASETIELVVGVPGAFRNRFPSIRKGDQ